MAAKEGYNFPFCGEENISQSFIDYGSPSMLNIDLDEQGKNLVIHPKRSYDSHLQRPANPMSLPLFEPNERTLNIPEESLSDYQFSSRSYRDKESCEKCGANVDNFSADYPGVMYSTIAELVHGDMNYFPWSSCNMQLKSDSFLPWTFLPWKRKDALCKLCSDFRQSFANKTGDSAQVIKDLSSALPDVPPDLLYDLFQESNALEIPRFHYDTLLGNCLACYILETEQNGLVMYPSGPGLDILNFSHISQSMDTESSEMSHLFTLKPVLSKQQFAVQGRIRQIDFGSYSHNNIIVGVRSQYHCSFFQSNASASGEDAGTLYLKPLDTLALTEQTMCITVSPYIPGEAVTVTETGTVNLWSCDHSMRTIHQAIESQHSPWYQCVFAANPRCIVMADAKGMDLVDFRVPSSFRRLFFSIPSSEVDSFECISAIQRHPKNSHHYVLATDQSLMLLDDRFLHHPVLKWRHHNEDPVQFISVACNAVPECDDTVLVVSGSNHHQTHCFQYSHSQVQEECSFTSFHSEQQYLPPQSTSLPWKVSSYDEWYYTGLSNDLTFSPVTASRLSQPLIGVCSMTHTSYPHNGLTVFQMSAAGDLFYQPFVFGDSKGKHQECVTVRSNELGPEAKILCQKWISIVDNHEDNFVKTAPPQVEYEESSKALLCYNLVCLPESHPLCVLCSDDRQCEKITERNQGESESSSCQRCGMEISYGSNLVRESQHSHGVLTRDSLNIQHNVKELGIFPDLKMATDPLSKSLWVNWNSSEPVPVILSGDKEAERKPDIQDKTVKEEMLPWLQNATSTYVTVNTVSVHEVSPQKQSSPSKSLSVNNPPKVKTDKKPARHVMGF